MKKEKILTYITNIGLVILTISSIFSFIAISMKSKTPLSTGKIYEYIAIITLIICQILISRNQTITEKQSKIYSIILGILTIIKIITLTLLANIVRNVWGLSQILFVIYLHLTIAFFLYKINDKKNDKKRRKWKITRSIALIPIVLPLICALNSISTGFSFLFAKYRGMNAFFSFLAIYAMTFSPIIIISITIIIYTTYCLKNTK